MNFLTWMKQSGIKNNQDATTVLLITKEAEKYNASQLLAFAEWMEYHSKHKLPEQCVSGFLKSQNVK